jgi:hypothetical protein
VPLRSPRRGKDTAGVHLGLRRSVFAPLVAVALVATLGTVTAPAADAVDAVDAVDATTLAVSAGSGRADAPIEVALDLRRPGLGRRRHQAHPRWRGAPGRAAYPRCASVACI